MGRDLEVLVEGVNPRNPNQAFGRIRHNKLAYFDGDGEALRGRLVSVRIEQANAYSLYGRIVGDVAPRDPLRFGTAAEQQQQQGQQQGQQQQLVGAA
jgi:tRNA-2-methylthio-N6-dimethylallyladenosine synthase